MTPQDITDALRRQSAEIARLTQANQEATRLASHEATLKWEAYKLITELADALRDLSINHGGEYHVALIKRAREATRG